ncbi:MAG: hypothetical protein KDJ97_27630 [Anaerolineae bacterium]|nr:hypothetical protein [Anaerolineae bacterium]
MTAKNHSSLINHQSSIHVPPDASPPITHIAPAMIDYATRSGNPADYWIVPNAYHLRYTIAGNQHALTSIVWCRQPTQRERQAMRQAFTIPLDAEEAFNYQRGWGSMTITWHDHEAAEEPKLTQGQLLDAPGRPAPYGP